MVWREASAAWSRSAPVISRPGVLVGEWVDDGGEVEALGSINRFDFEVDGVGAVIAVQPPVAIPVLARAAARRSASVLVVVMTAASVMPVGPGLDGGDQTLG